MYNMNYNLIFIKLLQTLFYVLFILLASHLKSVFVIHMFQERDGGSGGSRGGRSGGRSGGGARNN